MYYSSCYHVFVGLPSCMYCGSCYRQCYGKEKGLARVNTYSLLHVCSHLVLGRSDQLSPITTSLFHPKRSPNSRLLFPHLRPKASSKLCISHSNFQLQLDLCSCGIYDRNAPFFPPKVLQIIMVLYSSFQVHTLFRLLVQNFSEIYIE